MGAFIEIVSNSSAKNMLGHKTKLGIDPMCPTLAISNYQCTYIFLIYVLLKAYYYGSCIQGKSWLPKYTQ